MEKYFCHFAAKVSNSTFSKVFYFPSRNTLLFSFIINKKSDLLAKVLTCVQPTEAAEYLNVVKNEEETTVLHEAVDEQKSLEFTEILLNAGA